MKTQISITEIEAAINFWRVTHPSVGEELKLNGSAAALAEPYAMLIMTGRDELAVDQLDATAQVAIEQWREALKPE